jgi:hypothetical protein
MDSTVDVTIPVEREAAAALADARNRVAAGRLVSRVVRCSLYGPAVERQAMSVAGHSVLSSARKDLKERYGP